MKKAELESIIEWKAYLEYVGNLFEYDHTEYVETGKVHEKRLFFTDVNDGHDIDFREETILNCPNHFQRVLFDQVSKSAKDV